MKNLLLRGKDIASVLGLVCGGLAITILGIQINNSWIFFLGGLSLVIFLLFFILNVILLIRDFIKHGTKIIPRKF